VIDPVVKSAHNEEECIGTSERVAKRYVEEYLRAGVVCSIVPGIQVAIIAVQRITGQWRWCFLKFAGV